MPALSRVEDFGQSSCPDHGGYTTEYTTGASTVLVNDKIATIITTLGAQTCGHQSTAIVGSPTVFAENQAVHRIDDTGLGGAGDTYTSITGSPNVFNDENGGAGGISAQHIPMSPSVAAYYASKIITQPGITKYDTAADGIDDEGAPSDLGGRDTMERRTNHIFSFIVRPGIFD